MGKSQFHAGAPPGRPVPPALNIELFSNYARQLYDLYAVDAILSSCSTMNRAFGAVQAVKQPYGMPVVPIDEAMMEEAVSMNGRVLVIATHGPTLNSTQWLLQETADRLGKRVAFAGATVEMEFEVLGEGKTEAYNALIANTIREVQTLESVEVVLAQLSMSVFNFSYPDPVAAFCIPMLNSGETGFRRVGEVLRQVNPPH